MVRSIDINELENGAHRSQTGKVCPPGWAIIPDDVEIPETWPFVMVTTVEKDGQLFVESLKAGKVPDPEPEPPMITEEERLDALEAAVLALMEM